ncbi:MAG TPA: hypothetical protein VLT33_01940 [Labilithrix sp.]|nr:hypothetical protein [Labilithrix sp.]
MMRGFARSRLALVLLSCLVALAAGCRSAGPYGYAAQYTASSDEEAAVAGAREYDPVMVARQPDAWRKSKTSLFGLVTGRAPGPGGAAYLTLSVRKLETRNLCSNANDEDTCRVTVSDRDFGIVHVLAALRPDDDMGERSVGVGSLVRAVGIFGEDVDPADGAPVLRASFYRHWPRYFYVTRSSADLMRQ